MFSKNKRLLDRASKLIQQKNYGKARLVLWKIPDDPTARDWLAKIEVITAQERSQKNAQSRAMAIRFAGFMVFMCLCGLAIVCVSAILPDPPPDPVIVEIDARRPVPVFGVADGTGTPIATLTQGDKVEIKDKEGDWTQIEIQGSDIRGFVQSTLIVTLTNTPRPTRTPGPTNRPRSTSVPVQNASGQVYIAGAQGSVNVRSGPSTADTILGSLTTGTLVTITGESAGWYRINYKNGTGWVSKQLTSTTRPQVNSGSSSGANPPSQFTCPSNCAGARAMGLSPQQAASCGLDRDHDGVACYGD